MEERGNNTANMKFRVAVIGSHRARVAKVISLLSSDNEKNNISDIYFDKWKNALDLDIRNVNVDVQYVACVATFGSYEDGNGAEVRYLMKLEHHENQGKALRGLSLAPFFDEVPIFYEKLDKTNPKGNNSNELKIQEEIPGIAAFAIGCGIETDEDVEKIKSFLSLMSGNNANSLVVSSETQDGNMEINNNERAYVNDEKQRHTIIFKCIQPNENFKSMTEENKHYKSLDAQEKERVTQLQTLGPGKMTRFVSNLEKDIVHGILSSIAPTDEIDTSSSLSEQQIKEEQQAQSKQMDFNHYNDPLLTRFACKKCRRVLFCEKELEDPPHMQSQHNFSSRKALKKACPNSKCESVFLKEGLDWMGDTSSYEGKIKCYKCDSKLGLWNWSGNQCSCGTWVTPAIQIHLSRVDVVPPKTESTTSTTTKPIIPSMNLSYIPTTTQAVPTSPLSALHVGGMYHRE